MRRYEIYKRKVQGKFIGWEVGFIDKNERVTGIALFYGREGLKNAKVFLYVMQGEP